MAQFPSCRKKDTYTEQHHHKPPTPSEGIEAKTTELGTVYQNSYAGARKHFGALYLRRIAGVTFFFMPGRCGAVSAKILGLLVIWFIHQPPTKKSGGALEFSSCAVFALLSCEQIQRETRSCEPPRSALMAMPSCWHNGAVLGLF